MSDKPVTLTIDGQQVTVPEGTLVIRATEQVGVYVPRFCDHPYLAPLGACRQCMVEIEGQRKPLTSCTTVCTEGMVVKTQETSEVAKDAQDGVLELLLINHPLDCPMCDKGGECPLQDQTLAYGPGGSRYTEQKRRYVKPVAVNPVVYLDRERCVLCARCTRFAAEISGDPFIELFERGALEQVAIFEDQPYDSNFSGNVIQICPVGALTSRDFRFRARPFDMTSAPSVCNHCASGCSLTIQERRGQIVRVLAADNPEVNDVWSCDLGRFGHAYVSSPERITEPMVRKDGELVAVSLAEAVRVAAEKIEAARSAGAGAAVLTGERLADEDAYALSRFARTVLGTNDVDHRLGAEQGAEAEAVLAQLPSTQGATNADIDAAALIVVAGIDLYEESPILFLRVRKAAARGATVIEVNPRRTHVASFAAASVRCLPGGEKAGIASVARAVEAAGERAVILAGERLASAPGALTEAWNLAARTGSFGWIPRRAGARGALWAGLHPASLPAGRSASAIEALWGSAPPTAPGRNSAAILHGAASGEIGVLVLAGVDPAADHLDAPAFAGGGATIIAMDLFLNESNRRADVILPAAATPERSGTFTNWEGRAQQFAPALSPAGLGVPDWEILSHIAQELNVEFPHTLEEIRREMSSLARAPSSPPVAVSPVSDALRDGRTAGRPLALITYRLLLDEGTMMAGADELSQMRRPAFLEMHPSDARARGIADGDLVHVAGARGSGAVIARVAQSVPEGAVFIPSDQPGVRMSSIASLSDHIPGVEVTKP